MKLCNGSIYLSLKLQNSIFFHGKVKVTNMYISMTQILNSSFMLMANNQRNKIE